MRLTAPLSLMVELPQASTEPNDPVTSRMLAILDAPLFHGERPAQWFERQERALGRLFGELSLAEARGLLARLWMEVTSDLLARKFQILDEQRRTRLLGFLKHRANTRVTEMPRKDRSHVRTRT